MTMLTNKDINAYVIPGLTSHKVKTRYTLDEIAQLVSSKTGASLEEMSQIKKKGIINGSSTKGCDARYIFYYIAHKVMNPSYSSIKVAAYYGQKHCSCLHGCKVVRNNMDSYKKFQVEVMYIIDSMNLN